MNADEIPRGSRFGYRIIGIFYRIFGYWFVSLFARFIVFYYFVFHRREVKSSIDFYRAMHPDADRSTWKKMAWNQFKSFTTVFLDRFLIESDRQDRFSLTHEGLESLTDAAKERRPAILWMAHLGNWEVAVHCLKKFDVPITLIIGKYAGEQVEALQRAQLEAGRVKVVVVQKERDMAVMEVMKALRNGELVAISGDRLFDDDQQHLNVSFMGHECRVPKGPYVLAGLSKAPLIPIFGIRVGKLAYRFVALSPINVDLSKRSEREGTMKAVAQECFDRLESMVRRYPEQWYNFFKYWD